jgi:hypothetical protein
MAMSVSGLKPGLQMPILMSAVTIGVSLLCGFQGGTSAQDFLAKYKGTPFHDSQYQGGPQAIPGKMMFAYYDLGGEGVAYHDADAENHGSGELNPADGTYLNEFRKDEGVDTSYTKFGHDPTIDDSPYNKVNPPAGLLYVGWTEPGEWFNITVQAAKAGVYAGDLLYTSNRGGAISFDVNGESATGPLSIKTTNDVTDAREWRQWHHWNLAKNFVTLKLPAGKSVLTVRILAEGNMNLATLDFHKVE